MGHRHRVVVDVTHHRIRDDGSGRLVRGQPQRRRAFRPDRGRGQARADVPFTKIVSWRPAISGQRGPCGSGWVVSALNTMTSVALTAARMLPSAWPRSMKPSRRRLISRRACTAC